ncbi:hypothetical protein CRENBAI_019212 [Crenichthys baileyi]|uniref:Secreted protein n=1 Tax=Crenichthys baileyi TaxID=28760 RepID=A0AAV9SAY8_9TELE
MMSLWISLLLIGSIICAPSNGGRSDDWWRFPLRFSFGKDSEETSWSGRYPEPYLAGPSRGASPFWGPTYSPENPEVGSDGTDFYQLAGENWSFGSTEDKDEPFFSDINNQDPVFSLDAHSTLSNKQGDHSGPLHPDWITSAQSFQAEK